MKWIRLIAVAGSVALPVCIHAAEPIRGLPQDAPAATIDLMTEAGLQQVKGQWRRSDVKVLPSDMRGTTEGVFDYTPHAGAKDYDDSNWTVIPQDMLEGRWGESKGHEGRISFEWYRLTVTVPDRVGDFDTTGSTVVFDTTVDDYSEIWVDGELPRWVGQTGGGVISGFNVPNRIVIGRNVKPGQKIQIAVFGINGPLSAAPANTVFMRKGTRLDFYCCLTGPVALNPAEFGAEVDEVDKAAMVSIVSPEPKLYKLADGFKFNGGAVWSRDGHLLFDDMEQNTIYTYDPQAVQLSIFRNSAYNASSPRATASTPRQNGLTLDPQGDLIVAQEGDHSIVRLGRDGSTTVVVDSYEGKPLNGPHGLVYRSDGTLYFTDPRTGLPKWFNPPQPSLPYSGVYSLNKGKLQLLSKDLPYPFGIALSPDEKYLYVVEHLKKAVMRYDANADGTVSNGKMFFDLSGLPGNEHPCGMVVDQKGDIYVAGPGGITVISLEGKRLGTILTPHKPRDLAWGDADDKTLYLTTPDGLYRLRSGVAGVRPAGTQP